MSSGILYIYNENKKFNKYLKVNNVKKHLKINFLYYVVGLHFF